MTRSGPRSPLRFLLLSTSSEVAGRLSSALGQIGNDIVFNSLDFKQWSAGDQPNVPADLVLVDAESKAAKTAVEKLLTDPEHGPIVALAREPSDDSSQEWLDAGTAAVIDHASLDDSNPSGPAALLIALARAERQRKDDAAEFQRSLADSYDSRERLESQSAEMIAMAEDLERAYRLADDSSRQAVETARRLEGVINTVADSVLIVRGDGRIEQANPAAEQAFGLKRESLLGGPIDALLPGIQLRRDEADDRGSRRSVFEWQARKHEGTLFPVELSVGSLRLGDDRFEICVARDIADRKRAEARVRELALSDPLTKLSNRNAFRARLEDAVERSKRTGKTIALILMDLNKFKAVNDNFGHPTGDALLVEVAKHLKRTVRKSDTVARLGGDEFALVLPELDGVEGVPPLLGRIIDAICDPMVIDGSLIKVGTSMGVAFFPADDEDVEGLIRKADLALYQAKATGENTFRVYDRQLHRQMRQRKTLEDDLRLALARDEFELHVQPQIDVQSTCVVGAEALIRWRHPTQGLRKPAEFIAAAENAGLIGPIGQWVLGQVVKTIGLWDAAGEAPLRMAVNMSVRQLVDPGLVDTIRECLTKAGLSASRLEFEITETAIDRHIDPLVEKLAALRGLGVGLAIDDFGTGYASLAYLRRFPIQRLKIDQSIVRNISKSEADADFARAIVDLAKSLRFGVVAEGIETQNEADFFGRIGCVEMQGYFFAEPMPIADFPKWRRTFETRSLPMS